MSKSIVRQIIELENKPVSELRKLNDELMPKKSPANSKKDYLRPRIAYRLQELAFGSLAEETKAKLLTIAGVPSNSLRSANGLMSGTKICRQWGGFKHEVEVLNDCYEYQGQKFKSLSAIAKKITGTKWNGPKFFNLKS